MTIREHLEAIRDDKHANLPSIAHAQDALTLMDEADDLLDSIHLGAGSTTFAGTQGQMDAIKALDALLGDAGLS